MAALSDKEVERLLVVASGKPLERMGSLLGVGADAFFVCGSVFEAVAEAVLGREDGSIVVVTVDTLDGQEMGIFSTLAKMEDVATIAVTCLQEPNRKLQEALSLGADGGCSLTDGSQRLGELIQRFIRKITGTPNKNSTVIKTEKESKPVVSTKEHQGSQNRLKEMSPLSDEELTALLG